MASPLPIHTPAGSRIATARIGKRPASMRASTVIFDCDSTLSAIEGIESISRGNAEIEALTRAAMGGAVALESVYGARLEIVRPSRKALDRLGHDYAAQLVPDARAVIDALRSEGVRVRIMSGGLLPAVRGLGHALGFADEDVAAVDVTFDAAGEYAGYDTASPLARAGGKAELAAVWRRILPAPMILVGDGATDAEAAGSLDAFIAYCGVVERPRVVKLADRVIRSASLAPVLPIALERPPADAAYHEVYRKGLALLESPALKNGTSNPERT
jgi:phosphoserine phosphatase